MDRLEANFDSYEIIEAIGKGTLGTVYRAKQVRLNREVAVKFIDSELATVFSREDFCGETEALAGLYHPNIAMVLDAGSIRDQLFVVTELVDGVMLCEYVEAGRPDDDEILGIISQVCDGVTFAHERNICHLDLTPQHVLINAIGWVKLVDFRMSRGYRENGAGSHEGDPFSSPQLLCGEAVDFRADVYSLGKLMWFLSTGTVPPVHLDGDFDEPLRAVPAPWREVVSRAVRTAPELRFGTVEELRYALVDSLQSVAA